MCECSCTVTEPHGLKTVVVESKDRATYFCACGFVGTATAASHLGNLEMIRSRAKFNHGLHQARAEIARRSNE
jgi:hypothetical protein